VRARMRACARSSVSFFLVHSKNSTAFPFQKLVVHSFIAKNVASSSSSMRCFNDLWSAFLVRGLGIIPVQEEAPMQLREDEDRIELFEILRVMLTFSCLALDVALYSAFRP